MHGRLVGNQSCKCSWGKEPTHSNRLHSMNSNVSKAGSMLIPTSFGDESSRSTLLSGPLNVTPTIASSLSNLSVFPGWPANFSAASSVPFGTKLDCLPQLNMYGNVLDGLSTASAMDTSLPLRTLTSDPYKLNTMDLASDVAKNQYWSAGAKELESCLTSMVMTANNALSLPQTDSSKMDLVKSTANGTGASNLPLQEK
ncbi:unnamed protein product [Echinostoma caproni]|uniref:Dof-type domain-containing protein n=1 Tax=Echinostoma caproni TaxID=27848 RepID=A0A183BGE3_9TREM|nr:unnamed protein product [Echinostoma caproni]